MSALDDARKKAKMCFLWNIWYKNYHRPVLRAQKRVENKNKSRQN